MIYLFQFCLLIAIFLKYSFLPLSILIWTFSGAIDILTQCLACRVMWETPVLHYCKILFASVLFRTQLYSRIKAISKSHFNFYALFEIVLALRFWHCIVCGRILISWVYQGTHSWFRHYFCSNLYGSAPRGPRGVKRCARIH